LDANIQTCGFGWDSVPGPRWGSYDDNQTSSDPPQTLQIPGVGFRYNVCL